ncbi:MAG: hypothetical protein CMJ23_00400 [Phycisphaerae bacterium]|nr:hypothetical protein [Phycisphaerae bacterium]
MESGDGLPTGLITWTTLLSHWTSLVKASEGLVMASPDDPDAHRWRDSITEIVTLQAVTFALGDLEAMAEPDRALARDRADLAVTESAAGLDREWRGVEMPPMLLEIAADARRAVEAAVYTGLRWLVPVGGMHRRMPAVDLEVAGVEGTLAVMQPGTLVLPGEPMAWWTERGLPKELEALAGRDDYQIRKGPPVQVYRDLDAEGRVAGDLVASLQDLPAGLPLLVPVCLDGTPIGRFTVQEAAWAAANDAAFEGVDITAPVFADGIESTED